MLDIGAKIKTPDHGIGIVRKIDNKKFFPDYEFFYFVDFTGRKGDGTKIWMPKSQTEKRIKR